MTNTAVTLALTNIAISFMGLMFYFILLRDIYFSPFLLAMEK